MHYSAIAILAIIVNLILNWRTIRTFRIRETDLSAEQQVNIRYSQFLVATILFYLSDVAWGLLYQHHDIPEMFKALYADTIFYFTFMLLTMLTWARYIVSYLNKNGRKSKTLVYLVWGVFLLGMIYLLLNNYHHLVFSFSDNNAYIPGPGRFFAFIFQVVFYMATSIYLLKIAQKATGREIIRYEAVAFTSIVIGISLIIQVNNDTLPAYSMGLLIGTCVVHSFVELGVSRDKLIQDHIASVMAQDYEAIFYITIDGGEYIEFSRNGKTGPMSMRTGGKDFYSQFRAEIAENVYSEDKEAAESFFRKENMLLSLEGKRSFSCKYRFMVDGAPRFLLITYMRADDDRHIILYEKDINDELVAEKQRKESLKKTVTFSQIAESLASNYDEIYYVNIEDSSYVGYEFNNKHEQLEMRRSGEDFFAAAKEKVPALVNKRDCETVLEFLKRDNLISVMKNSKKSTIEYRMRRNEKNKYMRMTVRKTGDESHFIIYMENIDAEITKEKQHMRALKTEKELARRDELTGTKNKTAYKELEQSVQGNIDSGMDYMPFALVVCDANNLKKINDTQGHVVGDEYIKAAAKLICDTFVHSPVFRVGGDEFVVFLRDSDYASRNELIDKLQKQVLENRTSGTGAVLASGMAEYQPDNDAFVSDVFDRADKMMYENKQSLKEK